MRDIEYCRCMLVKEHEYEYTIKRPQDIYDILRDAKLQNEAEEVVFMICLNNRGKVNGIWEVSRGDVSSSLVHPREILKRAILCNASSIILAHNHPGGSLTPSINDKEVTKQIKKLCEIVKIELLDHVITAFDEEGYYSFAQHGELKKV